MITSAQIVQMVHEVSTNEEGDLKLDEDSELGEQLDSLEIVQLGMNLEDKAEELGFKFVWSEEQLLSDNNIFKSAKILAAEFNKQLSDSENNL